MTDRNELQNCCNPSAGAASAGAGAGATEVEARPNRSISPRYQLHETKDAFTLTLEMPGVDKDSLSIEADRETLTVRGRRTESVEGLRPLLRERVVADYHREFSMDDTVNWEGITASIQEGVVTVTIPKAADLVPRKVSIA